MDSLNTFHPLSLLVPYSKEIGRLCAARDREAWFRAHERTRFWEKVDKDHPSWCWIWIGSKCNGYGHFRPYRREAMAAHRYSWELVHGPIPAGNELDHKVCRTRVCVRPDHLVLGDYYENMAQPDGLVGISKARRGIPRELFKLDQQERLVAVRVARAAPTMLNALKLIADTFVLDPPTDDAILQTVHAAIAEAERRDLRALATRPRGLA